MSAAQKTIVIVGATGNQGSSVAHTFLTLPNWHVRCVTRDPSSAAAQALVSLGAGVVQANLSDIDSLRTAFDGAHAIFLNTDFWGPYSAPAANGQKSNLDSEAAFNMEVNQGKNAAIVAAALPTLERFIYSALGPMKKHSKGKYPHSYHWDSKATIVEYIENEEPALAKKTSYIYIGAFNTNPLFIPRINPETGRCQFTTPLKKEQTMPMIDPRKSTGPFVQALIETEEAGVRLLAYDSLLKMGEILNVWSKVSGQPADYVEVTVEYMSQQFGIPLEILDAVGYLPEYGYMGGVEGSIEPDQLKVKPQTTSFEDWLEKQDWENILETRDKAIESALGQG
ncbi:hypothetical protein PISL3812_08873 [Talaromyces islandicus]|uniref:NmrA-like domain-containing protein n=1 Tax=Talaromyces islandicus TaxID=28573 RepID=A0A0U1M8C0_TALIS|nr:hypothetical protein PISL3812_08873 [Talaromyces islandicus]